MNISRGIYLLVQKYLSKMGSRFSKSFFHILSCATQSLKISSMIPMMRLLGFWGHNRFLDSLITNREFKSFLDNTLPVHPLDITTFDKLPEISVVIPTHPKDFEMLQSVLDGLEVNSRNPIKEVVLISPVKEKPKLNTSLTCRFLTDEDVIGPSIIELLESESLETNGNWIKQQIIKILVVQTQVSTEYSLILDSDTIFLKERVFVANNVQELNIAREYHLPYMRHIEKFDAQMKPNGMSYVTHHQIWNQEKIKELWGDQRLYEWIRLRDKAQVSCVSEYQTYGQFLAAYYPASFRYTKWGNVDVSKSAFFANSQANYGLIKDKYPNAHSVSLHSYS